VSQSFSLFSVTPVVSLFSVIPSFLSVIPSVLSHSLYSQSFLLFSVILVLSSVIPSFSVIPPARPHLSAPSSSFFPGAQRLPKSPAAVIQPGPARQCGPLPYKKVPRPRTLNLAAAAPLETRSAAASFFPPPRRRLGLTVDRPFRCTPDHHITRKSFPSPSRSSKRPALKLRRRNSSPSLHPDPS
jgi:hypothetical protein